MYIENNYFPNSFEVFGFWNEETKSNYDGCISGLSLDATGIINNDIVVFNEMKANWCGNILRAINTEEYKFYLLLYVGNSNPVTRIQEYKNLWGQIKSSESIEFFGKGDVITIESNGGKIFCGAAQFDITHVMNAVEIISEVPFMRTIVVSKTNLLDKNIIRKLFNKIMVNNIMSKLDVQAYYLDFDILCKTMCSKGDYVFRLGDACEEQSFSVFYDEKLVDIKKVTKI